MSLRKDEIKKKLREMEDSVIIVKHSLPSGLDSFLELGLVKDGIYKKIEFAIENVTDICNIINADLSLGVPSDEEGVIKNLKANKILSKKMADKLMQMKSFRNVLVHKYGKIEDELAFEILQNNLADFNMFKKEILKILQKK